MLACNQKGTLRGIMLDEIHLYTKHGLSFREEIRILRDEFFEPIFGQDSSENNKPLVIGSTATGPNHILEGLSSLTHIDWTDPCHQMRSSMVDFRQRYIKMSIDINGSLGKEGYPFLIRLLKADPDAHTCIFVNFIKECGDCTKNVEDQLAENGLDVDVITITGKLEKDDKFGLVRIFTGSLTCEGAHPQILIGTGAVNTGIDQRLVKLVLRVGIPRCLETFFQERGRCSRDQELGTFLLCTD